MAHRMEVETVGAAMNGGKQLDKSKSIRNLFRESHNFGIEPAVPPTNLHVCTMEKTRNFIALEISRK